MEAFAVSVLVILCEIGVVVNVVFWAVVLGVGLLERTSRGSDE